MQNTQAFLEADLRTPFDLIWGPNQYSRYSVYAEQVRRRKDLLEYTSATQTVIYSKKKNGLLFLFGFYSMFEGQEYLLETIVMRLIYQKIII